MHSLTDAIAESYKSHLLQRVDDFRHLLQKANAVLDRVEPPDLITEEKHFDAVVSKWVGVFPSVNLKIVQQIHQLGEKRFETTDALDQMVSQLTGSPVWKVWQVYGRKLVLDSLLREYQLSKKFWFDDTQLLELGKCFIQAIYSADLDEDNFKPSRECSICMLDILSDRIVTRCQHHFHVTCLDPWLIRGNDLCPNCRRDVWELHDPS